MILFSVKTAIPRSLLNVRLEEYFSEIARIKTRISKQLSSNKQDWVEDESGTSKLPIADHEC